MSQFEATFPVHIHIGDGACRHLGDLTWDGQSDPSAALIALLRAAADGMDRASAAIAEAEKTVRTLLGEIS